MTFIEVSQKASESQDKYIDKIITDSIGITLVDLEQMCTDTYELKDHSGRAQGVYSSGIASHLIMYIRLLLERIQNDT